MVAILMIVSGLAGLVGATSAWILGGGLLTIVLTYAIVGNLSFAMLSVFASAARYQENDADFAAEIEADLLALLEERYQRLNRLHDNRVSYWYPLMRRLPREETAVPARERRLFRS